MGSEFEAAAKVMESAEALEKNVSEMTGGREIPSMAELKEKMQKEFPQPDAADGLARELPVKLEDPSKVTLEDGTEVTLPGKDEVSTSPLDEPKALNISEGEEKVFNNFSQMKDELGLSDKQIQEMKPPHARDIEKWFESGGSISIRIENGKPFWIYTDAVGRHAEYSEDGHIVFPPEAKHPFIGDISIENFTGDRNKDKQMYIAKLEEEYGLTDIPEGYVLHHDTENGVLQLIRADYHEEFTHIGGHSMYKEAA